ncbi:MAG: CHASE2 domain-containing protein [Shimia sp.]
MLRRGIAAVGTGRWLGLALLLGLIALRVSDPIPVQMLRNQVFDALQQAKPRAYEALPVTIVDIDDRSIATEGQWPWPRTRIADLVDAMAAQGARAIAFDIVFSEPDRLSPNRIARATPALPDAVRTQLATLPSNDAVLARAIAGAPVVLGQTSVRSATGGGGSQAPPPPVPHALLGLDPTPFLQAFPDLVQNLPELEDVATGRGIFTVRPDPDGVFRRVPLVMRVDGRVRLALAPELLRIATGGDAFAVRTDAAGIAAVILAGQAIETAGDGTVRPYFGASEPRRFVSATDLLTGRVPEGRLSGHLVLVGTSAIGLEDFRATPLGTAMAGVEVHAQLLENLVAQTLLVRPNTAIAVELVAIAALGLLVILTVPWLGARWTIAGALLLLGGFAAGAVYAFAAHRMLIDLTFPVLATTLTVMLMATSNYLREERQKAQIRGAFGQYVSPALVDRLTAAPEALALGGETRELTILFSDVRGFTGLAEGYRDDPEGLTELMNRLLTAQSEAVLAEGGTIDKFMGDAVMAFWNAPLDHRDHAAAACRAALGIVARVAALNAERPEDRIEVGVGLNTGTCVVGNMGSDTRFDYTALGDAVNLASRLEGQSKPYGMAVVLGESTARAVGDTLATVEIDSLRVKGKRRPERVFALMGDEGVAADPAFRVAAADFARALAAYRARDWAGARAALPEAPAFAPLRALYLARIAAFEAAPPPEDWDGVFVATTK